jgi:cytochrome c556
MTKRWQHLWTLVVLLVCLAVPWTGVQAQNDEAVIQYRQKVMQSNGASMGAISDILKNKLPYKEHIVTHAKDISLISAIIADAFKQQITEGKTDAKPEIWQDWEKFVAAVNTLEQESAKLAEVAQSDDMDAIAAQVKKLGGACGDCHKPFRKPKEESYKQQK